MKTFIGEDIIAVAVRHDNGCVNYFLTLGTFYWQADLSEIANIVLACCRSFALDGEPEAAEVCRSLIDASHEPYFHEQYFKLSQIRLPDFGQGNHEACQRQAWEIQQELLAGGHMLYCGSHHERKRDSDRFWSYGPDFDPAADMRRALIF